MSNTFNINRLGLLIKRQWLEFGKIYLISLLVLAGIIITFYAFNIPDTDHFIFKEDILLKMDFREPVFLTTAFLFISIISSTYFAHLGQKPRAIVELMIPCSTVEKFLAGIIFTAVLSFISYLLIFYVIDAAFVRYVQKTFDAEIALKGAGISVTTESFFTANSGLLTYPFYVLPFALSSLFLLGSVYFNRFHYIKTAISAMIFSGILSYVLYKASQLMFNGKVRIVDREDTTSTSTIIWMMVGAIGLFAVVLWFIGYVRLKEKEV